MEREGKEIKIDRGVRQDDPVSPKLFTAVLEDVFRQLDWDEYGISINDEKLSHLRFADELIAFSTSEGLQSMMNDLDTGSKKLDLS